MARCLVVLYRGVGGRFGGVNGRTRLNVVGEGTFWKLLLASEPSCGVAQRDLKKPGETRAIYIAP